AASGTKHWQVGHGRTGRLPDRPSPERSLAPLYRPISLRSEPSQGGDATKVAVSVVSAEIVTSWAAAPPSDQLEKT
ncbi:MAG: hypothetical protein QOF28_1849, partial [Actinomycetota bacterium]|nr:hypothetical protein [Actinomycetota bacterium]